MPKESTEGEYHGEEKRLKAEAETRLLTQPINPNPVDYHAKLSLVRVARLPQGSLRRYIICSPAQQKAIEDWCQSAAK